MKILSCRNIVIALIMLGLQACDSSVNTGDNQSELQFDSQGSMQLRAPDILLSSRVVAPESLGVEVELRYTAAGTNYEVVEQAIPVTDNDGQVIWSLALNIPTNVPFTFIMTWSELNTNLELVRITRNFEGFSTSQQVPITVNLSDSAGFSSDAGSADFAGFDEDDDAINNLTEINNGSDPFDSNSPPSTTIDDSLTPDTAPVTALVADPASLDFNSQTDRTSSGSFTLQNPNSSALPFTVQSDSPWITAEPTSDMISANGSEQIILVYSCDAQPEVRNAIITVESDGSNTVVPVSLSCSAAPTPLLVISDADITLESFVDAEAPGAFTIGNNGDATLAYELSTLDEWLSIATPNGSLLAGENTIIEFVAACGTVEEIRPGSIQLNTNNNGDVNAVDFIDVTIRCVQPLRTELVVSPDAIELNAQTNSDASSTVLLQNSGNNEVTFDVSVSGESIAVEPAQGTIQGGNQLELTATATCSADGSQSALITINSNADNGAQIVQVTQQCSPEPVPSLGDITPVISLTTSSGQSALNDIAIINTGDEGTTLEYTINTDSIWISTTPSQGALTPGASDTISVEARCDEFVGTRQDIFTIESNAGNREITVVLQCTMPVLADVTEGVNLSGVLGASVEGEFSFSNAGNADLEYEITSSDSWLSISSPTGTLLKNTTTSIDLLAQCGTEIETRTGTVDVNSNGGMKSVDITLVCAVPRLPALADVSNSVDLSAEPLATANGIISFSNTGNATLNYEITSNATFLNITRPTGNLQAGTAISVNFTAQCGPEEETRTGAIEISSDGGNASVDITLNCANARLPVLANVSDSVDLSAEPQATANDSISFGNTGNATLNYEITSDAPFLNITRPTGILPEGDGRIFVNFTAQCGPEEETRTGAIEISSDGGNASVDITLNCANARRPVLANVSDSVDLSAEPQTAANGSISFGNTGNATLSYEITSDAQFLNITRMNGILPGGEATSVNFTAQCGPEEETRTGAIEINSDGGNASVDITLNCANARRPVLANVSDSVDLSAEPLAATNGSISFGNAGNAALNYEVKSDVQWLSITRPTGILPEGDGRIFVNFTAQCGPEEETRTGTIEISSDGGDASIDITLNCANARRPVLANVSDSVDLSAEPQAAANGSISFGNTGNATLNYEITSDVQWLRIARLNGVLQAGATTSVSFTAQCANEEETRTGIISVRSDGGDDDIPVALNCLGQPLVIDIVGQEMIEGSFRYNIGVRQEDVYIATGITTATLKSNILVLDTAEEESNLTVTDLETENTCIGALVFSGNGISRCPNFAVDNTQLSRDKTYRITVTSEITSNPDEVSPFIESGTQTYVLTTTDTDILSANDEAVGSVEVDNDIYYVADKETTGVILESMSGDANLAVNDIGNIDICSTPFTGVLSVTGEVFDICADLSFSEDFFDAYDIAVTGISSESDCGATCVAGIGSEILYAIETISTPTLIGDFKYVGDIPRSGTETFIANDVFSIDIGIAGGLPSSLGGPVTVTITSVSSGSVCKMEITSRVPESVGGFRQIVDCPIDSSISDGVNPIGTISFGVSGLNRSNTYIVEITGLSGEPVSISVSSFDLI